jgi:predicted O-methyltransferase YrrM
MKKKIKNLIVFVDRYLYSLAVCFYLFTLGVLQQKNRAFIGKIALIFDAEKIKKNLIIPKVRPEAIADRNIRISVCEPSFRLGSPTTLEILMINSLAIVHRPSAVFEIGTFDGRTTLNLAANTQQETKIYTLDLPKEKIGDTKLRLAGNDPGMIDKNISGSSFLNQPEAKKITQLYGDSASFDFSRFYGQIDFIFIDGSHSYDYVKSDTEQALKLLKNKKGVIIWHDYGRRWAGVTRALNELYSSDGVSGGLRHIEGTSLVYLFLK